MKLECGAAAVDRVSDALSECGALSVTYSDVGDQPLYEPPPGAAPLWQFTRVTGLFDADVDPLALRTCLQNKIGAELTAQARIEPLADQPWERAWMDHFAPMRFGARLWICPSWCAPPQPDAVNIHLDPGLAFGTGTHATTALCLEWLDAHPPHGLTVLDYGCGSGILAIAAALLGAARVVAIDNDPQALLATVENARRNNVESIIETCAPEQLPELNTDLILANILANPLMQLAPRFARFCAPRARIVLSGILAAQAADVAAAYTPHFRMNPPTQRDDWIRLDGVFIN